MIYSFLIRYGVVFLIGAVLVGGGVYKYMDAQNKVLKVELKQAEEYNKEQE